jgi:hypothetical protein
MSTVATIEDTILQALTNLNCWAMIQSAGRKTLPDSIYYPACFAIWDGDEDAESEPRPIDAVDFKVIIQVQNLAGEDQVATDIYALNDLVRTAIRGKTLGISGIEPFTCKYRRCTDYDDSDGMIEYTHLYRTRQYQPIVTE